MKTDDFKHSPRGSGEADSPDEASLRGLFRRTTPSAPPVDVDRLLLAARPPRPERQRRATAFWKRAAAAVLLLALGGVVWAAGRAEARREAQRVERAVALELESLRLQLAAMKHDRDELVLAHEEGLKQLAVLLRNDYRRLLARVRAEMRGLGPASERREYSRVPVHFESDAQER